MANITTGYRLEKRAIVLGATGMAGRGFKRILEKRGWTVFGLSRRGPEIYLDLCQNSAVLMEIIKER